MSMSMSMSSSNKKKKEVKGSKWGRMLRFPVRLLGKARDLYVDSMNQCSAVVGYGSSTGLTDGQIGSGLPRSFSRSSTSSRIDEDYRTLVRIASLKHMSKNIESELARAQVKRSCSAGAGVGRIDEDKACDEFGEHDEVKKGLLPRSRTYAHSRKTRMF